LLFVCASMGHEKLYEEATKVAEQADDVASNAPDGVDEKATPEAAEPIDAEEFWVAMEGLRLRVRSVCLEQNPEEHASIDAEMIALRERVWGALSGTDSKRA
jgi:hypothetical protein